MLYRIILFLCYILFLISSCNKYEETEWLMPNFYKDITREVLLRNGYKRVPIDVPYYEKSLGDSIVSFQFKDITTDTCLYQIWEVKGDFNNATVLNGFLKENYLDVIGSCSDKSWFFVKQNKTHYLYSAQVDDDGTLRFIYDFPLRD